MSDLLLNAKHSLVKQSYHARERDEPLNGDGFGVGWYIPGDPIPCFFTSITPAWSNNNLHRLSEKIRSRCLFAHVRAATSGLHVNEANCHPFQYGPFLWMHNGVIGNFSAVKRRMRESLPDRLYNMIQGTTDSEHAFALFLDELGEGPHTLDGMKGAMARTIVRIESLTRGAGEEGTYLNLAVTDGVNMIATRYVDDPDYEPQSLYYATGKAFELYEGDFRMKGEGGTQTAIISSEPLTERREEWTRVTRNHMVIVDGTGGVEMAPIGGAWENPA